MKQTKIDKLNVHTKRVHKTHKSVTVLYFTHEQILTVAANMNKSAAKEMNKKKKKK